MDPFKIFAPRWQRLTSPLATHLVPGQVYPHGRVNSHGYVGEEFDLSAVNDCLIAVGCSFTEGVGVEGQQVWAEVLAQKLGLCCQRWALGGVGCSWIQAQVVEMFLRGYRPRVLAICWPESSRVQWWAGGPQQPQHSLAHQQAHQADPQHMITCSDIARDTVRSLCALAGVPLLESAWSEELARHWNIPQFPDPDLGWDALHPGPRSHKAMAQTLLKQYQRL